MGSGNQKGAARRAALPLAGSDNITLAARPPRQLARARNAYPFLKAYNTLNYADWFIDLDLATAENAPPDAVARKRDGGWTRLGELPGDELIEEIIRIAVEDFGTTRPRTVPVSSADAE